ncbi:hypothetical protein K7432_006171 [Basidiobolus ranarum]|uniref:Uncharacterized protein n=1 Tax=Basidiobolus ranarum TaxID=34480 RepID=A0ABR2W215_9FUNG
MFLTKRPDPNYGCTKSQLRETQTNLREVLDIPSFETEDIVDIDPERVLDSWDCDY